MGCVLFGLQGWRMLLAMQDYGKGFSLRRALHSQGLCFLLLT